MKHALIALVVALLTARLAVCQSSEKADRHSKRLPTVQSGEMPLYPSPARMARIEGKVTLRVSTDGETVREVTVIEGQPLLAKAAQQNVRTWRFETHPATSFDTVFTFHLVPQAGCGPLHSNGQVVLTLPEKVDITAAVVNLGGCDPEEGLDLSEPLKVFLTACEVDGASLPCDDITIRLVNRGMEISPERFKLPDGRQGFIVPAVLRNAAKFGIVVRTSRGTFSVIDENVSFLKGNWRLAIDHAPFQEEWRYLAHGERCFGLIEFQWGEPETLVRVPCHKP